MLANCLTHRNIMMDNFFFLLSSLGCSTNAMCENQCGKAPECRLPLLIRVTRQWRTQKAAPWAAFKANYATWIYTFFSPVQFEVVCKYFFSCFFFVLSPVFHNISKQLCCVAFHTSQNNIFNLASTVHGLHFINARLLKVVVVEVHFGRRH